MRRLIVCAVILSTLLLRAASVRATETENLGIRVLPTPGKVMVDGKFQDWDLSGGIFVCGDVENAREQYAVWFNLMYDTDRLYVLARFTDKTPLNNPGSVRGDYGFAGDCLQVRFIAAPGTPAELGSHWTCWRDRDERDAMFVERGTKFDAGTIKDAKAVGAEQAFVKNADGSGYVQEMSIPWKLLGGDGYRPKAGEQIVVTVEPNFTLGINGRLTLKDIFKDGVTPDRVFTFMASNTWGVGTLESKGGVAPAKARLADGREFGTTMKDGQPVIDWTGLAKSKSLDGFAPIAFSLPKDGYVSLNIKAADGTVVRQLLNNVFFEKGDHVVKWDGLTTPNWRQPGEVVPAGEYTWSAIAHDEIGLKLRGWADNGGDAPWDSTPTSNWGGDHGLPAAAFSDGKQVYLGWTAAEAGRALLALTPEGKIIWKNNRGGIAGAVPATVDAMTGTVYAYNDAGEKVIYRVDSKTGGYTAWKGTDSADVLTKDLGLGAKDAPSPSALAATGGHVFAAFASLNTIVEIDDAGQVVKRIDVRSPNALTLTPDAKGLLILSDGKSIKKMSLESGATGPVLDGLQNASTFCVAKDGTFYVGVGEPANQVLVFSPDGKPKQTIGRAGGRAKIGKWQSDGMLAIAGLTIAPDGKLWVAEADNAPKRVSVWDPASGKLISEYFGPSSYGALGGAIDPQDPNVMVGQGCEWRINPATGRAACLATITRDGMEQARFAVGSNGKVYLAVAANWAFSSGPLSIYERLGDADYKLRTVIYTVDKDGKEVGGPSHNEAKATKTFVWADRNDDGLRQPDEISSVDAELRFSAWYMAMTPDLTFYGNGGQFKTAGFTACGAPQYDLAHPIALPKPVFNPSGVPLGSIDGKRVYYAAEYGVSMGWSECYDIASGKRLWRYPDNFVGVHGSHNAIPPQVGMIRGSFGPVGAAHLPNPIGDLWVISTNVGEWHILTADGFYLTKLFQGDPTKMKLPDVGTPGAIMNDAAPGMGGEDFGGSIAQGTDGKIYFQAGKTAYWNLEVTGLETIRKAGDGKVIIAADQLPLASGFRDRFAQEAVGTSRLLVRKSTPAFTGNFEADFKGSQVISFKKQDDAAVRSATAWDDANLYVGWEVHDGTPWINAAAQPEMMYLHGDTVDLQLSTDPSAQKDRDKAGPGDLRLSIGNFGGKPTAVLYRPVSADKHTKVFSSGIIKGFTVDSVIVLESARINIAKRGDGYTVEAAIPVSALGLKPVEGLNLRGDFGATHGGADGERTRLRTYWNNQQTGIVDDAVFELMLQPKNWGDVMFKN